MTWSISSGADVTTAEYEAPSATPDIVFVFAHGAGGNMHDRAVMAMTKALIERGIGVVRFNFFYRARKSGRPDSMPRLVECIRLAVERVRSDLGSMRLIAGGRSMGGRAASMHVADGARVDGLLLLAYPLHPPGHPEKLRDAHLASIDVPVMCVNGTRDPFCDPEVMARVRGKLGGNFRMHWLEAADHGFHVLKSSGRTDADVVCEAADAIAKWASAL